MPLSSFNTQAALHAQVPCPDFFRCARAAFSARAAKSWMSSGLKEVNKHIHSNLKDSAGDCEAALEGIPFVTLNFGYQQSFAEAFWRYRSIKGEVKFASPQSEVYRSSNPCHCMVRRCKASRFQFPHSGAARGMHRLRT